MTDWLIIFYFHLSPSFDSKFDTKFYTNKPKMVLVSNESYEDFLEQVFAAGYWQVSVAGYLPDSILKLPKTFP